MKVQELIDALSSMPPDAEVLHLWDGEPRTAIEHVWLSIAGDVITSDDGQVCYNHKDRPESASKARYWRSPESTPAASR